MDLTPQEAKRKRAEEEEERTLGESWFLLRSLKASSVEGSTLIPSFLHAEGPIITVSIIVILASITITSMNLITIRPIEIVLTIMVGVRVLSLLGL